MRLSKIAKDYNLRLTQINKKNAKKLKEIYDLDEVKENGYVIDNEHIILGIFDDYEKKLATLFHEIGHTLVSKKFENLVNEDTSLIEYEAWIRGLKEAKKRGIYFSGKTFKYILKCINTYYDSSIRSYNKRSPKWKRKNY